MPSVLSSALPHMILLSHLRHAIFLCMLPALVFANDAYNLLRQDHNSSHLTPRVASDRHVHFEVALNLPYGEGTSSGPTHFPAKTALWIEGSGHDAPLKIDLRLVRYPSRPNFPMFTPYVQELHFDFPHFPTGSYHTGDWITVHPGVELFACADTHLTNDDIMSIRNGKGILLNRIKDDQVLTTALVDPNIFMYDLLLDIVGTANWRYERLITHLIDSRDLSHMKNEAWAAFMPLAVYQAGNNGMYRRFFDFRDTEHPEALRVSQVIADIKSITHEVMPEALNPYVASWGTVELDSSAQPPEWKSGPEELMQYLGTDFVEMSGESETSDAGSVER
ncbi:hypothetical protein MMC11_007097 [Xylographa trunciseda]|nr:hypothetical protein [Xylographa trunciseda]